MNGEMRSDLSAGGSSPGTKPWERPWSIDELKKSSTSWSLACDAGLLQHMQEYSQRLISQTHDIQAQMDGLAHEAKLTNSRLSNVFNDFITLANTQFMENRVYDEEVVQPVEEKSSDKSSENKTKTKEEKEAELIPKIKEAISLGLNVFDSAYETLDMNVANSDSEDEISVTKADIILEPKDPYINRILPYLIGSEQFHRLDDLGLKHTLSVEKEDSGSESEDEVVKQADIKRNSITNTASVKRQSIKESEEEESDDSDLFGVEKREDKSSESSSESSEEESHTESKQTVPANKPMDFSSELAAKLGVSPAAATAVRVSASEEKVSDEVNDKKSKTKRRASKSEEQKPTEKPKVKQDLFGSYDDDNADDGDDLFSKPTGLFSSKAKGLFDNEDEDEPAGGLFDKKQESKKPAESKQQKSVLPEQKKPETSKPNQSSINPATDKSVKGPKDLFEEEEDDDDDLFASLAAKPRAAAKTGQTIISDSDSREASDSSRPSSAVSDSSTRAKPKLPAGAVSLFGGAEDPFKSAMKQKDQLEGKTAASDSKKSSLLLPKESSSNQTSSGTSSLFGDDDDDGDDLFGASSKQTKSSQPPTKSTASTSVPTAVKQAQTVKASLFADDDEDGGDLFGNSSIKKAAAVKKEESRTESKKPVVADPIKDDDDDDDDLFSFKPKSTKNDNLKQSSQAASVSNTTSNKAPSTDTGKKKEEKASIEKSTVPQNKAISLFGDDGDDDDDDGDLFSAATKKKTSIEDISKPKKRSPEKTKPSRVGGGGGDLFADEDLLFGSGSVDTPAVDLFKPVLSSQNNSALNPLTSSKSEPRKTSADSKPVAAADKQKDKTTSSGLFGASLDNDDDDDDDDLFSTKPAKKIPPGAVSLFGNQHDLLKAVSKRRKSSSTDESSESKSRETTSPAKTTDSEKSNVIPSAKPADKPAVGAVPIKREKSVEKQLPGAKAEDISANKSNSVIQSGPTGKKSATSNLFSADDEINDDDDDLFAAKPTKKIPPGAVSLFGNQSDLLKEAVNKRRRSSTDESVDGRETTGPEKSIPTVTKASDDAKRTDESKASAPKSKISQLQSSLNIDPTLNLPGAKPKIPAAVEVSVGFNAPPTANTLNSMVKDRVKVQTKRRPPSRKTNKQSDEVDEPDALLVSSSANGRLPSVDKLDSLNFESGKLNLSQSQSPTSHLGNDDDLFSSIKVSLPSSIPEKEISSKTSELSNSAKDISVKQDKINDVKIKTDIAEKQQEKSTASSVKDSSKVKDSVISNSTPSDKGDAVDALSSVKNEQEEKSSDKNATTKSLLDRLDDADLFSTSNLGSKSAKPTSKKLVLSDDDDDLFGSSKMSKNSAPKLKSKVVEDEDLFGDSTIKSVGKSVRKEDDSDLFPKVNQPSKSNVSSKPAVQLDDDDDIFSSSSLFTSTKKPETKPTVATGTAKITKDDDDIFSEPSNIKKGATSVKQSKVLSDSDDDIFADSSLLKKSTTSKSTVESKSQIAPTSSIRKKAVTKDENLFNDDTDIFSTASKPSSQLTGKTVPANKKPVDEDDIFGDQSSAQKSTATSKSNRAAAGMKRVDSSDIFDDPLNALQK